MWNYVLFLMINSDKLEHTLQCSQVQGTSLAVIQHMLRLSVTVLWAVSYEIPSMLVTLLSYVFEDMFHELIHIFIFCAGVWSSKAFSSLSRSHIKFELKNHSKTYVLPITCCPKQLSTFQQFPYHFPAVSSIIWCRHTSFHSAIP
jgi:hypothetical protein